MIPIVKKLPAAKVELAAARATADALRDQITFTQQVALGNRTNDLMFLAQVIELLKNGVMQRLSERLPHSPAITSAASSYGVHPGRRFEFRAYAVGG